MLGLWPLACGAPADSEDPLGIDSGRETAPVEVELIADWPADSLASEMASRSFYPEGAPWRFGWAVSATSEWMAISTASQDERYAREFGRVWVAPVVDWTSGPVDWDGRFLIDGAFDLDGVHPWGRPYALTLALDPTGAPRLAVAHPDYRGGGYIGVLDVSMVATKPVDPWSADLQVYVRRNTAHPWGPLNLGINVRWLSSPQWGGRELVATSGGGVYDADDRRGRVFFVDPDLTGQFEYDVLGDAYVGHQDWLLGYSLGTGGDADGDGEQDLVVGEDADDVLTQIGCGVVYLMTEPPSGEVSLDDTPTQIFGEAVGDGAQNGVIAPDVDGDGYDDLLIGAWTSPYGGERSGSVYLVPGSTVGVHTVADVATARFDGRPFDFAGRALVGVGDLDLDGYGEIAVSAPGDPYHPPDRPGSTLIWRGADAAGTLSPDRALILNGQEGGEQFGITLVAPGDLDADGIPDLLLGSPYADVGGRDSGGIWLLSGSTLGI